MLSRHVLSRFWSLRNAIDRVAARRGEADHKQQAPEDMTGSSSRSEADFALLGLPESCIVRVFQFLSDRDACMLEVCCKDLRRIGQGHQVWDPRVEDCLGILAQASQSS